jgi:hypothetical protein
VVDIGYGEDTILVYQPITLYADTGYASYLWQDWSTGTEFGITEPSAGWYTVIVTGDNGCETHDSVYVAYDRPDLAITGIVSPVSSCSLGEETAISVEILNNGFYRLAAGDTLHMGHSLNLASPVFEDLILESELPFGESRVFIFDSRYDFSGTGSYNIQVNVYNSDEDSSNNMIIEQVDVWGSPYVQIGDGQDTLVTDLPVTLDAGSGYESYQWQDESTGQFFEATSAGLHWVIVTDEHGCPGSDSVYVTSETAVEEYWLSEGTVRIYPNPVEEVLHVSLELEHTGEVIFEFHSITGVLIHREDFKQARLAETEINVRDLFPGTYCLRITTDKKPHDFMIIVTGN